MWMEGGIEHLLLLNWARPTRENEILIGGFSLFLTSPSFFSLFILLFILGWSAFCAVACRNDGKRRRTS